MRCLIFLLLLAASLQGGLPAFFIENPGEEIRFIAETPRFRAGFGRDFVVFQLHDQRIRLHLAGANQAARLSGADHQAGQANFLLGEQAAIDLATYGSVVYSDLYTGIDAHYKVDNDHLKSEFTVAPGADPSKIRLDFSDGEVLVAPNGELAVRTLDAELREHAPIAYQETANGRRVEVRVRYRALSDSIAGFELGEYDPKLPLVIDPTISYSTFLGGSGMGSVTGIAVDPSGNLYVTGWTEAMDFPIAGAAQAANRGGVDGFVVKLNPAGNTIIYATYFGGSAEDRAAGIVVDALGQVYIAGSTGSANFPVVSAFDATFSGSRDAFVLKLNATGNMALFSTFLGGSGYDAATAITLDASGNAYVTGDTQSANFPHPGAVQGTLGGKTDAFIATLSSAGTLTYGTYVGGSNDEHSSAIAIGPAGNIHIAGGTTSTNFPIASSLQSSLGGGQDGFITELNTAGSAFQFSTYWGGSGGAPGSAEQINGIAVDSTGAIYVVGTTSSTNFPISAGAFQGNYSGAFDAFLTKIAANGTSVIYSTYLGGNGFDWASAVAVDSARLAHIAGYTSSPSFVSVGAVQSGFKGLYDAFIAKFNLAGNAISFGTLYGGTGADAANAVAVDGSGNIYLGGQTSSFDLALIGPIQSSNLGNSTGWVAKIGGSSVVAPTSPGTVSVSPASGSGNTATFTAAFSHSGGATNLTTVAVLVNNSASLDFGCYVTYNRAMNQLTLANDTVSSGGQTVAPGGNNVQNTQCSLNGSSSSVSISGTNLTLNLSLTFLAAFTGTKTVYLYAADSNTNTGLVSRGSWTVTLGVPVPSADSVSPSGGAGSSQTFSLVYSDTQNATNLTQMGVLFQATINFVNACNVIYDRAAQSVALVGDTGATSTTKLIGSPTVLQNSQCSVGATSAVQSGLSIILSVAITFKTSFAGGKNIYMYAAEGPTNTGWIQRGTFLVALGGTPAADSVVPSFGSGPSQRFSFTVSDTGGGGFITGVAMLFSSTLSTMNACSLVYDRTANTIALAYDNPANGQAPVTPGSSLSVSNSQCTLRGPNSTVVTTTNSVVVTVDLLFNANFFGSKSVFLLAAESGTNSGWRAVGNWVVTGGAPTADSISPSSGTGRTPSFTFAVSDSTNQQNIIGMSILMTTGSPSNITNACYLVYDRVNSTIGLYSDDGVTLSTKGVGSAANLQNSQCAVGYTVMTVVNNSVLLTVNLVLSPAFTGTKSIYLMATEPDTNSGWVLRGIWAVP